MLYKSIERKEQQYSLKQWRRAQAVAPHEALRVARRRKIAVGNDDFIAVPHLH